VADDLADGVLARLENERNAWLCTLRADGSPHVTPIWFIHLGGTWWIGSSVRNRKVVHMTADPRVSLALEDGDAPLVAEGHAVVHHDGFPSDIVAAFATKYDGWDVTEVWPTGGPRVLIEVTTARWLLAGVA
jgi:hypothetical protein